MSKLLQRLSDAAKSGVYRASRTDEIMDATRGGALRVTCIDLGGVAEKDVLLTRVSGALQFPDWFGRNWDALKDCLADLSWIDSRGHVLLFENMSALPSKDQRVLVEILSDVAPLWARDGRPFFAVFVGGAAALPELYRTRK